MAHGIVAQRQISLAGGQDAALAIEMVRARPLHDQKILLDDPALRLLNDLNPIAWPILINMEARDRWTLLTCFTDPWGADTTSDAVSVCGECGNVRFHDSAVA